MKKAPIYQIVSLTTDQKLFEVKIKTTGFADVVGNRLKIKYDPTMLKVVTPPKVLIPGAMAATNILVKGEIVISWFLFPPKSATMPDGGIVATLQFAAIKPGTSQVYFLDDQGGNACSTRYAPNDLADDTPFATCYLPGSVTFK